GPPEPREDRVEREAEPDRGPEQRAGTLERAGNGERTGNGERNGNGDRGRNDRGHHDRSDRHDGDAESETGSRRGRRSRFRDRRRGRNDRGGDSGGEPQVTDDDVLVQVAGIVDVLDNYAFIRTSGYLAGPNDVYVSMAQIKKYGLRRGDAVTGAVRAVREGEQRRDKYNPLVRLDSINGMDPEEAKRRPEFYKLTPLYPQERLRP